MRTTLLILGLLALIVPGIGQEISGTLSGVVKDGSSSSVNGVAVAVRNVATGVTRSGKTDESGLYLFPFVAPGVYELTVTAKGFQQYTQQNIAIETNQRRRVDVVLTVGEVTQTVTVAAVPLPLETASGSLGQTVDSRAVVQLPNLNRNPLNVVFVAPNIAPNNFDRQSTTAAATMSSINGARPDDNETIIDGGSTISPSSNIAVLNPNVDAIAEVRIEANSYSAEFGRVMGGVVIVTTRSGGNDLHGTLFEFHRNAAVSARNFFDVRKPCFTRNQFGGAVGGPLWIPRVYDGRNRTFFFLSFEAIRQVQGLTNLGTLPTAAMREGNFAGLAPVFDPATTAGAVRQPFPGSQIPVSRFDPVARNILSFYPQANAPSAVNNYVLALPTTTRQDRVSLRGDHNFGDRNRLFLRYMWDNAINSTTNTGPRTLPDERVDPSLPQQPYPKQAIIGDTHTISPRTVNEFRASFFRFYSTQIPGSYGLDFPSQLGLRGVDPLLFPRVDTQGILPIGHASVNNTRQNLFSWSDTVSHVRGAHSLKFGFNAMRFQFNNGSKGAQSGQFSFNQLSTAQPGQANTGHPVASLLLGLPISSSIETLRPIFGYRYTNFGWFAQDDFRVNSQLTLNLGLRYEIETPLVEVNDLQSTFDVSRLAFIFAGRDGQPRALSDTDYANFGPRIGFAWAPGARLAIRGGYGVAYASTSSSQVQQQRSVGFTAVASFPSPDNGLTFPVRLRDGVPAVAVDPVSVTRQRNINVNVTERYARRAQMHQWNLNMQRQLGDYLIQLAYSGSKGTHLVAANYSLNQVPTARLGAGNAQPLRPYPDFQEIIVNNPNEGNSIYNGVSLSVNRRFARGLTLISSFTFQKAIDSTSGRGAFIEYGALRPQDNFNRRAERSVSQFDRTKRLVAAWVYELPWRGGNGPARFLTAGWEVSGMLELMDGTPLAMSAAPNRSNSLGGGSRPNRVPGQDPKAGNWTPQRAFNTAAYSAPEQFAFGNVSRTEPSLRAPGWATVDLSLLKNFPLRERVRLEFRVEAFNLANRMNFQRPTTVLGTPQFGQITLAWPARSVQGGLKLIW